MNPDINEILTRPIYKATSKYGAQMGRSNQVVGNPEELHLQKILPVDGDYDNGGAYWGFGTDSKPLYCAFSPEDTENEDRIMVFVRATSYQEARELVLELLPEGFTFFENPREVDEFTQHFLKAALFFSNDNSNDSGGSPLDRNYSEDHFTDESFARIKEECIRFQEENKDLLKEENCLTGYPYLEQAGHDFFLTRNGTGSGFQEEYDWKKEAGKKLYESSKKFKEMFIEVGDDGKLYYY